MNHCKICGNNIPDEAEDCHQAGFGEGCMKTMRTHNTMDKEWESVTWNVLSSVQIGRMSLADAQDKLDAALHHQLQKAREKAREEALAEYKQFVLNVLDGVDIADGQCNTKAIRFALKSRIIHSELDQDV